MFNKRALETLIPAEKADSVEAFLYTESEIFYAFVQNPNGYKVNLKADLSPIIIPGASGSKHNYKSTSNREISLPGIIFDSYAIGFSLDELIEKIEGLMIPGENDKPPLVGFRWGFTNFYPCYLTDFSYDVELLLSGSKAKLTADISLTETDEITIINAQAETVASELIVITDRERVEATEIVNSDIINDPGIIGGYQGYSQYLAGLINIEIDNSGIISKVFRGVKTGLGVYDSLSQIVNYDR